MAASDESRLEAEERGLTKAIERAQAALAQEEAKKTGLQRTIARLKKSIGRLEAKGPQVIALQEYRRMRSEVLQAYRALAEAESSLRKKSTNLKNMCRELTQVKEQLRDLRRPRSA